MNPEVTSVIAVGAAAAAVWLGVAPHRLRPRGDPPWRRAAPLLRLVAGRFRSVTVRARDAEVARALPAVCTLLAVCLEAGLPLRNAVDAVAEAEEGPTAAALRRLAAEIRLGVPERDAWTELGERQPALAGLVRELRHASGTGVALAPVLRQHAREARAACHASAQARARRAGVSTVLPLTVCFLPAFLLVGVVPVVGGVLARLFG